MRWGPRAYRPLGLTFICSIILAWSIFLFESQIGRIGGTFTILALLGSSLVAFYSGYMGGGYPETLFFSYFPFAGSGIAIAVEFSNILVFSSQMYHILWSLSAAAIMTGTMGFLGGRIIDNPKILRENRGQIIFVFLTGIILSGILWYYCSPFSTAKCGAIGSSL